MFLCCLVYAWCCVLKREWDYVCNYGDSIFIPFFLSTDSLDDVEGGKLSWLTVRMLFKDFFQCTVKISQPSRWGVEKNNHKGTRRRRTPQFRCRMRLFFQSHLTLWVLRRSPNFWRKESIAEIYVLLWPINDSIKTLAPPHRQQPAHFQRNIADNWGIGEWHFYWYFHRQTATLLKIKMELCSRLYISFFPPL